MLDVILLAGHERFVGHPDDRGIERIGHRRHIVGPDEHVAAADVDFVFERERDRHRREGFVDFAVVGDDRLHAARLARGERHHRLALADAARGNRAAEAAEVEVRAVHELHGIAEVDEVAVRRDVHVLQVVHQRRTFVPRHVVAVIDEVVALERADRDEVLIDHVEPRGEFAVVGFDLLEDLFAVADEVHLVDRDQHVLDAQQRHDERVPLGLGHHAVAGVDQDDRQIAGARPGGHVAGVLLVAGAVGDDEFPLGGREIAVRHVDGDALLALGLEAVGEQRGVEVAAGGAVRGAESRSMAAS